MDASSGFRPPAPVPQSRPLGPLALLKALRRNPLECWAKAHFEEPVVFGGFPFAQVAVVSDPTIISQALIEKSFDFRKGALERRVLASAGLGEGLVAVDGEQWHRQRRTVAPVLGRKLIVDLAPVMAAAIASIIGTWHAGGEGAPDRTIDVKAQMSQLSLAVLVRCMFSPDFGEDPDAWSKALTQFFATRGRIDPFDIIGLPDSVPRLTRWRARRMLADFDAGIDGAIARRRDRPCKRSEASARDILALVLGATDPETGARMSDTEVKANLLAFFFAGQETTSTVLTWVLYLLSQSPPWRARVTAEARQVLEGRIEDAADRLVETRAVVEEAMRLYPPIVGITRSAAAGARLGDRTLARRTMVIVSPYVLHRHRLLWTDPDVFDPGRFLTGGVNRHAYLPFGIGPRMCIGAAFAMQEAVLAVAMVMKRYTLALATGQTVWPVQRFTLRPRDPLLMVMTPVQDARAAGRA